MAYQDLTTYTEVDPNGHISTTSTRITYTNLAFNEDAYDYSDKGVDHFNGDFTHLLDIKFTGDGGGGNRAWVLANDVDDAYGLITGGKSALIIVYRKHNYIDRTQ
jgi:hypothetical protein